MAPDRPAGMPGPVLLYDGDCGFCEACARWLRRRSGAGVEIRAWQTVEAGELAAVGLAAEDLQRAAYWVDATELRRGHDAIAAVLGGSGRPWAWVGRILELPGISQVAAVVYRAVARWRHRIPVGDRSCAVPQR